MKLSVITPTFNRKKVIMNAVKSVFNGLPSKWKVEMIIVDDGSTDGTYTLFKKNIPGVRYFYFKKNCGVNVARNKAVQKARGNFVLLLDSDDALVPNWGAILDSYFNKLHPINFFGTVEKKNFRKMYTGVKEGKYFYRDWLSGRVKGEFLSVVKRSVFKEYQFDESHLAFENFFWNRVIKKYGVFVSENILRLYSYDAENRISRKLISPKKAEKQGEDYESFIKEFRKDYLGFGLKKQYSSLLFTAGVYRLLSDHMQRGRELLKQSLKFCVSFKAVIALLLSFSGYENFLNIYKIIQKMMKV